MCGRDRPGLALLSDRRLEWRCRTSRRPSRLARARLRRLTALTGAVRPSVDGHPLMAQRERYAAPHRKNSADKFAPFSRWSLPSAGRHGSSSKISIKTNAVIGSVPDELYDHLNYGDSARNHREAWLVAVARSWSLQQILR